jgi:hypothetical protein
VHGHLHNPLIRPRLRQHAKQAFQHGGMRDRHTKRPVLTADIRIRATQEQELDHLETIFPDRGREGGHTLCIFLIRIRAVVEEPVQSFEIVAADGHLDDALGRMQICAGGHEGGEEVHSVVRYAFPGGVFAGHGIGVGAVGEEEREDLGAVVADGGAEGGVDAVFLGIRVNI